MDKLIKIITQNTQSTDKILVNGNQASIYLYSHRACATRFLYPIRNSSLADRYYIKEVEESLPKIIVQGGGMLFSDYFDLTAFLNDKYRQISTDMDDLEVWILKNE
jgi:hypothetical protein